LNAKRSRKTEGKEKEKRARVPPRLSAHDEQKGGRKKDEGPPNRYKNASQEKGKKKERESANSSSPPAPPKEEGRESRGDTEKRKHRSAVHLLSSIFLKGEGGGKRGGRQWTPRGMEKKEIRDHS